MACGCPVIASKTGGIPEIIQATKGGLLVKKNDSKALASTILKLYKNEKLRKKLRANGLKNIKQFNLNSQLDQIEDYLKKLKNE